MDRLTKAKNSFQTVTAEMKTLLDSSEDVLSAEQQEKFDALKGKAASLKAQVANYEQLAKDEAEADRIVSASPAVLPRQTTGNSVILDDANAIAGVKKESLIKIPAKCKRWSGRLHSFKGPDADVLAYKAGMWFAAHLCGNKFAQKFCATHGIATSFTEFGGSVDALYQEGVNTQGGYLVFDELETAIIRLVEEYGLVRRIMKNVPMMSDTKITNRRTGGLTAFFIGEGEQIGTSTGSWDQIKLIAKKLAAIAVGTNEVQSDAIISIIDDIVREIALAMAIKEDLVGFQGDGESTSGGITGIVQRLSDLNGVDDGGGLILSANNTYAEITDAELTKVVGQVPNFPGLMPEWYCSKPFFYQVMSRLTRAAGGVDAMQMGDKTRMQYAGYPVNWTSGTATMPVTAANSQISCLFGDMRMAAQFGDRAGITIAQTTEATVGSTSTFDTDSFAVRGIERFDINVHDVGSATEAGPVVGLILASS